jgi:O-antigen ligase
MRKAKPEDFNVEDFYFLKIKNMWKYFWSEHPAFWCICGYLFFEYFRPQSIYPIIDFLPWAQLFLCGSFVLAVLDKKSKFSLSSMHYLVVFFAIQLIFSIFFAYDDSWSKKYFLDFFQWVVIFFVITFVVTDAKRFYLFFLVFFLCSLKIAIGTAKSWAFRGFSFAAWGLKGPSGYFENSGELAIQMLILISCSLYLIRFFWVKSLGFERLVLLLSVVSPALTIMGASSRGSQLSLFCLLILYFNWKLFNPKILLVSVIMFLSLLFFLPESQKTRFESMGSDRTSEQRLLYWSNGLEMISENPLFGVGYFNFIPYYSDVYPNDVLFTNSLGEKVAELPHNILIQLGTDAGIPAIFIFTVMIYLLLKTKIDNRELSCIASGLKLGLLGFFIAGQFVTVMYYPFFWISAALITSLEKSDQHLNDSGK